MFVWENQIRGGCWSGLGQISGYSAGVFASMTETGSPPGWQMIAMAEECGGGTAPTVHHEVLHALGVGHEHNRPDRNADTLMARYNYRWIDFNQNDTVICKRDDYLIINTTASSMPDSYYKINASDWQNTGYPFELASVMTYCSYCSGNGDTPVATLHDGSTFWDGERLTTTDALQIQNKYCKMKDERKDF